MPPTSVDTTGNPEAHASGMTHGKFSCRLFNSNASCDLMTSATSEEGRGPKNSTTPSSPRAFALSRYGPKSTFSPPTNVTRSPGTASLAAATPSSNPVMFFWSSFMELT